MKKILFLLLPLAPALALAQTGTVKDSVRVLTTAEISAGNTPADTSHFYYIEGGSWKKVRMDSIARVARLKLAGNRGDVTVSSDGLTWDLNSGVVDSMQLSAGAVVLPGAKVTGTLPVSKGGTNTGTLTANKLMVGNATSGVLTPADLHWNNSASFLGIGETDLTTSPNNVFKLTVKGNFPVLFNTTSTSPSNTYGGTRFARSVNTVNAGNGFQFSFLNSSDTLTEYAYFGTYIIDNTVGSTDGGIIFSPTLNNVRTDAVWILNTGNVGIGTSGPSVQLHTTGQVRFAGEANFDPVHTDASGNLIDGGVSDANLKNTIQPIQYGLSEINALNPVSFHWNDENRRLDNSTPDMGFIAQDVMNVIPESVRSNGNGELQLDYKAITATLVKAIQQQQAQIEALQQRITQLENK